jgi:hypothetical protein
MYRIDKRMTRTSVSTVFCITKNEVGRPDWYFGAQKNNKNIKGVWSVFSQRQYEVEATMICSKKEKRIVCEWMDCNERQSNILSEKRVRFSNLTYFHLNNNSPFLCGLTCSCSFSTMLINDDDLKSNSELLASEPKRRRAPSDRGGACFCLFDQTRRRPVRDKARTGSESRLGTSSVGGSSAAAGAAGVGATRCTAVREGEEAFAFSCVTVRGSGAGRGASKAPLSISESPIVWVEGGGTAVRDDPAFESSEVPGRCT